MDHRNEDPEELARRLEATGNYRILRRLLPRQPIAAAPPCDSKVAVIVDFETTGLDAKTDEIIEVAMVKFRYSNRDEVIGVIDVFQAFNQPSMPIPSNVIELTNITDEMVAGCKIDDEALEKFVADANVVIAHNAAFDRNSRRSPGPCLST